MRIGPENPNYQLLVQKGLSETVIRTMTENDVKVFLQKDYIEPDGKGVQVQKQEGQQEVTAEQQAAQAANAGASQTPDGQKPENTESANRLLAFNGTKESVNKDVKEKRIEARTEEFKALKDADGKELGVKQGKKAAKAAVQEEIAKERIERSRYYTTQAEYDAAVKADTLNENRHVLLDAKDVGLLEAMSKDKDGKVIHQIWKETDGKKVLDNDAVKEMLYTVAGDSSLDAPQSKDMTDERGAAADKAGLKDNRSNRKTMANFYEKMGFDVQSDNRWIKGALPWIGGALGAIGGAIAGNRDANNHPERYVAEVEYSGNDGHYSGTTPYSGSAHFEGDVPYSGTVGHDHIEDGVTVYHVEIPYSGRAHYEGDTPYSGNADYEGDDATYSGKKQGELTDLGKGAVTVAGGGLGGALGAGLGAAIAALIPGAEKDAFKGKSAQEVVESKEFQNIVGVRNQAITNEILRVAKEREIPEEQLIQAFKDGYGAESGKVITERELIKILNTVRTMDPEVKIDPSKLQDELDKAQEENQNLRAENEALQEQLDDCCGKDDCVGKIEEQKPADPMEGKTAVKINQIPYRTGRWYLAQAFENADGKPLSQRDIRDIMNYLRDNTAYLDNSRGRHTDVVLPNEIKIGDKVFKLSSDPVTKIMAHDASGGGSDPKYGKITAAGSKYKFTDCDGKEYIFNTRAEAEAKQKEIYPNMKK